MAAAAVPVPGKREWLSRTVNLALHSFPGKRRVRSFLEGEPVLIELRPAAVHTVVRRGRITAIVQSESFIGLIALGDEGAAPGGVDALLAAALAAAFQMPAFRSQDNALLQSFLDAPGGCFSHYLLPPAHHPSG